MRLVHTADWHLGHTLHEQSRAREHEAFLTWLLQTLEREQVDGLLIAGDVFDTANPSAEAQSLWYRFLARARTRMPWLGIVVIGGNHDSAARLDAPSPLLDELSVHIVGGLPRTSGDPAQPHTPGPLALDRLIVPLYFGDANQRAIGAWVCAVPFLRPIDLPAQGLASPAADRLVAGVRRIYAQVLDAARARRAPGQALVAMGHCYMMGTQISEISERKVLGGNQHALPLDVFASDLAYVALGHLHLAQCVGGRDSVRYSGAPLPLSLAEADYPHQVCLVELHNGELAGVTALAVPRARQLLRMPERGAGTLAQVLAEIAALAPARDELGELDRPLLEVRVRLDQPEPALRRILEQAVALKAVRLVKITQEYSGSGLALPEAGAERRLEELRPDEVFRRRYQRDHETAPPPELWAAFHELLEQVERGELP